MTDSRSDTPADLPDLPDPDDVKDLADRSSVPAGDRRTALEAIERMIGVAPSVFLPGDEDESGGLVDTQSDEVKGAPRRSGQYQVLGEIARGGVGVILKSQDLDLGRDVAMKVLRPDHADKTQMIQRFVEEAQIGGQLQHPGIIPVYELGVREDGRPFFTMKLVKGRTLGAHLLDRINPTHERGRFLSIFESICQTVAYAHSKGVVHRDLKPSNIMIGTFGEVLVVDWGLAKVLARGGTADEKREVQTLASQVSVVETVRTAPGSAGSDSITGSVLGTPGYMAPEQARGEVEKVDPRSDVFSLGCILCELLTGEPPYSGSPEEILLKAAGAHLDDALARLDRCSADETLVALARECLTPAQSARPKDAAVLAERVHAHQLARDERLRKAELDAAEARHKRRITTLSLVAALLFVVLGGGGYWYVSSQRAEERRLTEASLFQARGVAQEQIESGHFEAARTTLQAAVAAVDPERATPSLLTELEDLQKQSFDALVRRQFLEDLATIGSAGEDASPEDAGGSLTELQVDRERRADRAYRIAFDDFSLPVADLPLDEAVGAIRSTGSAVEICRALDAWVAVRRTLGGPDDPEARHLLSVALSADLDPGRQELRQAVLARDVETLVRLANIDQAQLLPPTTLNALLRALLQLDAYRPALDLADEALRYHRDDVNLNLAAADALTRLGRQDEAIPYLVAAAALQPDSLEILVRLASEYHYLEQFDRALELYKDASRLHPDAAEPWYRRQWTYTSMQLPNNNPELVEALEEALLRAPSRYTILTRTARVNVSNQERLLRHAEEYADDVEVLVAVGRCLTQPRHSNLEEAVRILEEAVALDPNHAEARRRLADALMYAERPEEALTHALEATRLEPTSSWGHNLQGAIQSRVDDLEGAIASYRASLAVRPTYDFAADNLLFSLHMEIHRQLEEDDELEPTDDPWILTARALHQIEENGVQGSTSLLGRALRLDPAHWFALELLASIQAFEGRWDDSIATWLELFRIHPRRGDRDVLVNNLRHLGRLDEMIEQARLALGANRNNVTLANLAQACWFQGDRTRAERLFRFAYQWAAKPDHSRAILNMCRTSDPALDEDLRYDTLRQTRSWASEYPDHPHAHCALARALYRVEEHSRARAELERAGHLDSYMFFVSALLELVVDEKETARERFDMGMRALRKQQSRDPVDLAWRDEAAAALGLDPEDWEDPEEDG